jgi:outer membrane protein assembly factor BamE
MFLRALIVIATLLLVSCGSVGLPTAGIKPYRIEIQQGNFISQEMVSKLKLGMSKDQVRFVLGTPLITDSFHSERWDYVFRRQRVNSTDLEQRNIAVFFEDGKLKRIEGDVIPASEPVAQTTPSAAKPAPAGAAGQPGAEPVAPAPDKPQEKNWWQRLKEMF